MPLPSSKFTAGGSISNHAYGRGLDIASIDGEIVGPGSPLAREVASELIEFDAEAQSQAKLSTRQKTLFVCEFGRLGQNYTVRVRHPFEAGQDVMEGLVAAR